MYNFLVITGILLSRTGQSHSGSVDVLEKVRASMTVDESTNQPTVGTPAREVDLVRLYEQFRRPIHSYAFRLLGSQDDADDVTQEVFMRAFTSWEALYERDHLSAWLYRIATNLCVDLLRRRKRHPWRSLSSHFHRDDQQTDDAPQAEDFSRFLADSGGIPEIAEREVIRQTLARMPDDMSVVLVLNAAQGIPYQEIAMIVGISPNAAATRISRAKKLFIKLYQSVSKDGVGMQEKKRR